MLSASQLWDVCVALGCDPNTVLGWYEDHPEARPREASPASADEGELLELYRRISPERRGVVRATAEMAVDASGEPSQEEPLEASPRPLAREA